MEVLTKSHQIRPVMHFLRRNGGWFRPKAAGYTDEIGEAGIFTAAEVLDYMKAEGVEAVTVHSMKNDIRRQAEEALAKASKLFELALHL